jgi:long-chain acyl-CoA synthetase
MPDIAPNRKDALVTTDARVTFAELRERVREEAAKAPAPGALPLRLEAARTPDFVVRFLTALESGTPVAVFAPEWTAAERAKREALLDRFGADLAPGTAVILFTSGSSGEPKAVQLSRAGIEVNTRAVVERLRFADAEEQTLFLPLSYSYGLLGQLLPALAAGVTTHLLPDFLAVRPRFEDPASPPKGMWSGVASHWSALARMIGGAGPFPLVTHAISAGARLDPSTKRTLRALFPNALLSNNYGQTEASPRILSMASDDPKFFEEATGYAVPGISVRLSAEGELEACGPQIMRGYLGDPSGTAERLRGGWLHTGDLARIEDSGLVTILGRMDDLVKVAGERISPLEVEAAVLARAWTPEACVVPVEDALYGTRLVLFLGGDPASLPKDGEILRALRESLSPAKVPSRIVRMAELPRNANGKFDRRKLRETAAEGKKT